MKAVGLLLLIFLPAFGQEPEKELEAPDRRSYAEATPQMLRRRAKTCRQDLKDYRKQASLELMDRLIVCMEHPDPRLRDEVLDFLPDRTLWDRPDYESAVRPQLGELYQRVKNDPDDRVRLHAGQLSGWLGNGESWRNYYSPAAQERQRREREQRDRRHHSDQKSENIQLVFMALALVVYLVVTFSDWLQRRRRA